jgi:hypothetical protein
VGYPGSSLYDEMLEKGLYEKVDKFVALVKTKEFDFEKVNSIQRQYHRKFNRTPKRVLKVIRRDGLLSVLKRNI